jgi:hypothetical protein
VKRRRNGLTITNASGSWATVDGRYEIVQMHAVTYCDGPHPERTKTGNGYCYGGEEHDYIAGWGVFDRATGREITDEPEPTLNGAHDRLADLIATRAGDESV